jgi:hypothetical protein
MEENISVPSSPTGERGGDLGPLIRAIFLIRRSTKNSEGRAFGKGPTAGTDLIGTFSYD